MRFALAAAAVVVVALSAGGACPVPPVSPFGRACDQAGPADFCGAGYFCGENNFCEQGEPPAPPPPPPPPPGDGVPPRAWSRTAVAQPGTTARVTLRGSDVESAPDALTFRIDADALPEDVTAELGPAPGTEDDDVLVLTAPTIDEGGARSVRFFVVDEAGLEAPGIVQLQVTPAPAPAAPNVHVLAAVGTELDIALAGSWEPPGVPGSGSIGVIPDGARAVLTTPQAARLGTLFVCNGGRLELRGSRELEADAVFVGGTITGDAGAGGYDVVGLDVQLAGELGADPNVAPGARASIVGPTVADALSVEGDLTFDAADVVVATRLETRSAGVLRQPATSTATVLVEGVVEHDAGDGAPSTLAGGTLVIRSHVTAAPQAQLLSTASHRVVAEPLAGVVALWDVPTGGAASIDAGALTFASGHVGFLPEPGLTAGAVALAAGVVVDGVGFSAAGVDVAAGASVAVGALTLLGGAVVLAPDPDGADGPLAAARWDVGELRVAAGAVPAGLPIGALTIAGDVSTGAAAVVVDGELKFDPGAHLAVDSELVLRGGGRLLSDTLRVQSGSARIVVDGGALELENAQTLIEAGEVALQGGAVVTFDDTDGNVDGYGGAGVDWSVGEGGATIELRGQPGGAPRARLPTLTVAPGATLTVRPANAALDQLEVAGTLRVEGALQVHAGMVVTQLSIGAGADVAIVCAAGVTLVVTGCNDDDPAAGPGCADPCSD